MNKKGMAIFCVLLLTLTLIFPAAPSLAEYNAYVKKTDAGNINLRSGPAAQYRVLASIPPLTRLEVIDVEGKWAHVYVADPKGRGMLEGYMYTNYIEDASGMIVPSYPLDTQLQYSVPGSDYSAYYSFGTVTENTPMYVYTRNSGKLHLREYASQNARSLGLFPNGTQVTVLNRSGRWAYVYVNGYYGYMMLDYLTTSSYFPVQPIPTVQPISGAVTKYIYTGNSGRLHLREYASENARSLGLFPNGTQVSARDLGNGWSYVTFNGYAGYMMTRYLTATPYTPVVPDQYTVMYVYSPTGGKVILRAERSQAAASLGSFANGTPVYVVSNLGAWSYVIVNGVQGYMLTGSLSAAAHTPIVPGSPIGTATVQHPNGSFVYLRSSRSTGSLDNVLAKVPSGAKVTVYQKDEWYSLIEYNGITGYMVSQYLYNGAPVSVVPVVTAAPTGKTVTKMIVGGTPLLSARNENSGAILQLPHGAMVEILLTYPDTWRYVDYNGIKGYIHGKVVADVTGGPKNPTVVIPSVPAGSVTGIGVIWHPNGSYVNLRYSCSTADNTNVLAQMPYGSKVEVMGQNGAWTKVRYNGIVGYMVSSYLYVDSQKKPAPVATAAPAPATIPAFPLTPATPITITAAPAPVATAAPVPATIPAFPLMPATPITVTAAPAPVATAAPVPATIPAFPLTPAMPITAVPVPATPTAPVPATIPAFPLTPATPTSSVGQGNANQRFVRNQASTFVYLRSSTNSDSLSNVIMKVSNGTPVQVLSTKGLWSYISVQGTKGYMVSRYLSVV